MSDNPWMNSGWRVEFTATGKPKVVDANGFSICNMGGGSHKDQLALAKKICQTENLIAVLRAAREAALDDYSCGSDLIEGIDEIISLAEGRP